MNLLLELPEAISNTVEIAGRCNVELEFGKYFCPIMPYPRATTRTYLRSFAIRAPAGYTANWVRIRQRLGFELGVITDGLFCLLLDSLGLHPFCQAEGIPVGRARLRRRQSGSLQPGITNIDPLRYGLLFERF